MIDVSCVLDAKNELGECPVWSAEEQSLYWVDTEGRTVNRLVLASGATTVWPMPRRIGSFGLREAGGAVVALEDGFHLFDFDTGAVSFVAGPDSPAPGTRFNYDLAHGTISNRRVLTNPTEEIGRPDGAAVDVDGYYWSAGISAGTLNRWASDGHLDRSIPLPCSNPTMPCFGLHGDRVRHPNHGGEGDIQECQLVVHPFPTGYRVDGGRPETDTR